MTRAVHQSLAQKNVKRFRGGLVLKAHRLVHPSTLGWSVIKKKRSVAREAMMKEQSENDFSVSSPGQEPKPAQIFTGIDLETRNVDESCSGAACFNLLQL